MENEKFEDHKIGEDKLENVAGGARMVNYPYTHAGRIELFQEEKDILDKAHLLHRRTNGTSYVKGSDYEKIKDALEKSGYKLTKKDYKTLREYFTGELAHIFRNSEKSEEE